MISTRNVGCVDNAQFVRFRTDDIDQKSHADLKAKKDFMVLVTSGYGSSLVDTDLVNV